MSAVTPSTPTSTTTASGPAATGRPVRWGIAGPGRIARGVTSDFPHVDGAVPVAVGSRDQGRADAFAREFGLERAHGSYAELCADPEVDVIYIATPHPQHKAIALEAIANGKGVMVEKAFCATLSGAQEVVDAARAAKVFCMEAMWTRFHPLVRELHRIVDAGQLGELRAVQGDFCFHREVDLDDRLFAKELGGGAILDLGVYPLSFAVDFLGTPNSLATVGSLLPNGIEGQAALQLGWERGAMASLMCSLMAPGSGRLTLLGSDGWVDVESPFHHAPGMVVHRSGTVPRRVVLPTTGNGYTHELQAVTDAVREGRTEHELMPLDETLLIQGLMEEALHALGVNHHDPDL